MQYYHDLVTDKSFNELTHLKKAIDFVLIGGWAVYFYTKSLKSKDIDIIIDYDALSVLREKYTFNKNERLKKYEAIKEEVQIDIYLPHYSSLGIPVEDLIKNTVSREGFDLLEPNYLFAIKIYTLSERGRSAKGRKDFLDLISLFVSGNINIEKVSQIINNYSLRESLKNFNDFLVETTQIKELNLNSHVFSKVKKDLNRLMA